MPIRRPARARPLLAILAAALAASLAVPSLAAEARKTPATADTTKPVMFLEETVVTGSRYPHAYYESPQALSFVSRRAILELQPTVLGDVLATLPGVESNKDSPWEQRPSIRGLTGQRVLVLVDGTPMNSVRGNGPHPSLVDPAQVERIEVVRGPSSVAYGSDALGGVINIITRQPRVAAEGRLEGTLRLGGSLEGLPERNGSLDVSTRWNRLSVFLEGGGRRADDYKNADGEVPQSSFGGWNAMTSLRYDFTDGLDLRGGYQLSRGTNIGIPGLDVSVPGYSQAFRFKAYDRDFAHATLEQRYPGSSWLSDARARAYWQREHRNFYSDIGIGIPMGPGSTGLLALSEDRILDLNTYGFQAQVNSRRTERYRFGAGLDLVRDLPGGDNSELQSFHLPDGSLAGPPETVASASVPHGRFDSYAGYVQSELFLGPRWTLNAGGRYTRYRYRTDRTFMEPGSPPDHPDPFYFEPRKVDDGALSGSVGLVFAPIADLHLTANVATGYREPNAQDLFFSGPGSVGFVVGNPDLKPERSVSYDAGARWGPGNLAISGDLFLSTFRDLINALPVAPPPEAQGENTYRYTNIATARMWGGEAEAEWQFLPQWRARAAVTGTVGDVTSREAIREIYGIDAGRVPLELVPPFGGWGSLRWSDPGTRIWAEAGARYSWRTNRLPPLTPGAEQLAAFKKEWIVFDLSAGAQLETGQRLVAGVRNVADLRYREPLGSVTEPGRTFYASIASDF